MTDPFAQVAALPGVADAVAAAREAVDGLLAHRVLRRRSAEVSAEAALRGARASAALEGSPVSLEAVRAGTVDDPFVRGALRVSAELGTMPETWRHTPRHVLARLHVLTAADLNTPERPESARTVEPTATPSDAQTAVAVPGDAISDDTPETAGAPGTPGGHAGGAAAESGATSGHWAVGGQGARVDSGSSDGRGRDGDDARTVGAAGATRIAGGAGTTASARTGGFSEERLGRPRTAGQDVHSAFDIGPAPDATEMAARLDALMGLLTARTEAPALVVGAIVHAELLALRPFGVGDGIVARAAQRVTFIERGLDPKALAAPEVGHAELADAYADALRAYMTGTPAGVATWVRHCADAVSAAARDSLAVCEAMKRGQVTRSA